MSEPTHANCRVCGESLLWWDGRPQLCWNPACERWLKVGP